MWWYLQKSAVFNTHHCHVVQHATINPPFIKLGFILRQTDVIQPSWWEQSNISSTVTIKSACRKVCFLSFYHKQFSSEAVVPINDTVFSYVQCKGCEKYHEIHSCFTFYVGLAAGTHLLPNYSPAFLYYPPPLSQEPAEPAEASFCAGGVWCPAPKHSQEDKWEFHNPQVLKSESRTRTLCMSGSVSSLIKSFCLVSPAPGPAGKPVAVSVQRRSTHEPCLHKGQDPAPAATHKPDPLTNVQMERPRHYRKKGKKYISCACRHAHCWYNRCIFISLFNKDCFVEILSLFLNVIVQNSQNKKAPYCISLYKLNTQTHLLTRWRSRDQPNLGPAVARTPPRLNSPSGRLSSRLKVVDWLLLSLLENTIFQSICHNVKKNYKYFFQYSLSKQFLYSFRFFPAFWCGGQSVRAVTVRWPLWQPSQIQVVSALSFGFSCTRKAHRTSSVLQSGVKRSRKKLWHMTTPRLGGHRGH